MWSPLTHLPPVSYMQDIYLPDEYHSMSHTCPADLKIIGQVKGMDFLFFNKQFFPFTKYFHGNVNISCAYKGGDYFSFQWLSWAIYSNACF